MRKWLTLLLLLCLLAPAAAAEKADNPFLGAWVLTARGDQPAQIGSERLLIAENGEGVWTKDGAMTVFSWTMSGGILSAAIGETRDLYALSGDSIRAQDGRTFARQADHAECAGVWTLDRARIEQYSGAADVLGLEYTLILAPDGTGLFSGAGMDSVAVTHILRADGLHVHADDQCMLFAVDGDTMRTEFESIDGALSFVRSGGTEPEADAAAVRTTGDVNLRGGAGTQYEKITTVDAGTELPYEGETQTDERGVDWYRVAWDGKSAWVSSNYAELIEE